MAFDLSKFKNLFIENTSDSSPVATKTPNTESSDKTAQPVSPVGKPDQSVIEALYKTIEEHNLPGEDYLEFVEALKAMQNIPLEDSMKVQTVMATLSTKGLTVEKIRESADYYKKILVNEQNQFVAELNSQVEKNINSKKKTIEALNAAIKQKSDQIVALTKEINEAQQNIASNESMIKSAETKIETAKENFNVAYNFVINQINDNISKLK